MDGSDITVGLSALAEVLTGALSPAENSRRRASATEIWNRTASSPVMTAVCHEEGVAMTHRGTKVLILVHLRHFPSTQTFLLHPRPHTSNNCAPHLESIDL